jgi:hypothetical protein
MDRMSCNLRGQGREGEAAGTSLAPNLRELLYSRMWKHNLFRFGRKRGHKPAKKNRNEVERLPLNPPRKFPKSDGICSSW